MGASQSSFITNPKHIASASVDPAQWTAYDYVICGGGTAGCVLASRLSEDPSVSVLVLEAGQSNEAVLFSRIPFGFPRLFHSPVDWNFNTVPQKTMDDRQIYWPRGKMLGGSSSINALIYHHCAPDDFNEWERLGATGWGYKDLLPFFKKSENYTPSPEYPTVDRDNHGSGGPIYTSHQGYSPLNVIVNETCKKIGVPRSDDLNTPCGTLGVTNFLGAIDPKGQRSSAATAYLTKDVLARSNLTVVVNVRVEKVLFSQTSGSEPRAVGVELSAGPTAQKYRVTARREVLVTAGAVGTPQILMLSGIGPASELKAHDIPVVKELPAVGKNLSDHMSCGPMTLRAKPGRTWDHLRKPLPGLFALIKWLLVGSGPMSGIATAGGAFIRSDDKALPLLLPDGENGLVEDLTSGPVSPDIELVWVPIIALNDKTRPIPMDDHGLTMSAIALRPSSTGSITLKSTSVWDAPAIDANYFASESDMNVVIRGARLLLAMARMEPLRSQLDLKSLTSPDTNDADYFWPGDADPAKISDEQLKSWIRKNGAPSWHPVSSARMGQSETTSVVGPDLRVHGVQGLRVVDASVFPKQVSGHPCAVVVAIAEKAAELIKRAK